MKTMYRSRHAIAFCLSALMAICGSPTFAQAQQTNRDDWVLQMNDEEKKIVTYVDKQMSDVQRTDVIRKKFLSSLPATEAHEGSPSKSSERYARGYYRKEYLALHPELKAVYNPGRVAVKTYENTSAASVANRADEPSHNVLCQDGDFEAGTSALASYNGYSDYTYVPPGGLCGFIPFSFMPGLTPVSLTPNSHDFALTNNTPDPNVPINQTHNNSNHALRINGWWNCNQFGMNMLQKSFLSPVAGNVRINFSYALVMQFGHPESDDENFNGFFVARVLDNAGVEVTRICNTPLDPGFNSINTNLCESGEESKTQYKDWTCEHLDFEAEANKTYTIEFFVSGCAFNIHYGYAYVDDICAEVCCGDIPVPTKLKCTPYDDGSHLDWGDIFGVSYYKVYINEYDPQCCPKSPDPTPNSYVLDVYNGSEVNISSLVSPCFSWYVVAIMQNGCISRPSGKQCSCNPAPPRPDSLDCDSISGASRLSWGAVPGAVSYKVTLNQYDPLCCASSPIPNPVSAIWNVSGTTVDVPYLFATCFSWSVVAVFADGTESRPSVTRCSCNDGGNRGPLQRPAGANNTAINSAGLHVTATPNPASAYVEFTVDYGNGKSDVKATTLHLYDRSGKEVIKGDISSGKLSVDVSSLADGIYIYAVRNNSNQMVFKDKIVIKK